MSAHAADRDEVLESADLGKAGFELRVLPLDDLALLPELRSLSR